MRLHCARAHGYLRSISSIMVADTQRKLDQLDSETTPADAVPAGDESPQDDQTLWSNCHKVDSEAIFAKIKSK